MFCSWSQRFISWRERSQMMKLHTNWSPKCWRLNSSVKKRLMKYWGLETNSYLSGVMSLTGILKLREFKMWTFFTITTLLIEIMFRSENKSEFSLKHWKKRRWNSSEISINLTETDWSQNWPGKSMNWETRRRNWLDSWFNTRVFRLKWADPQRLTVALRTKENARQLWRLRFCSLKIYLEPSTSNDLFRLIFLHLKELKSHKNQKFFTICILPEPFQLKVDQHLIVLLHLHYLNLATFLKAELFSWVVLTFLSSFASLNSFSGFFLRLLWSFLTFLSRTSPSSFLLCLPAQF